MSGVNGKHEANIRGVAYTLNGDRFLSAARAAMDEAKRRRAKYDGFCKEYNTKLWRRRWQGLRWTAALFVGVPLLTAVWGALAYLLVNELADDWWRLLAVEVVVLASWTAVEVFARAAYGDDDAVGKTDPVSEAFRLWVEANAVIAFMPILATVACFGRLVRTWRGADLEEIAEDMLDAYEWLMTPRLQMGQLLNEAIPTLNALTVIADTSAAVRQHVPTGYRFTNIEKCRYARDGLWAVVDEMLALIEDAREPSNDMLRGYERVVEATKKSMAIEDRRVAQIMLEEIKEGK